MDSPSKAYGFFFSFQRQNIYGINGFQLTKELFHFIYPLKLFNPLKTSYIVELTTCNFSLKCLPFPTVVFSFMKYFYGRVLFFFAVREVIVLRFSNHSYM